MFRSVSIKNMYPISLCFHYQATGSDRSGDEVQVHIKQYKKIKSISFETTVLSDVPSCFPPFILWFHYLSLSVFAQCLNNQSTFTLESNPTVCSLADTKTRTDLQNKK